ncbi:MAG: c-type cytochrome [Polyangiaceae bacterium]
MAAALTRASPLAAALGMALSISTAACDGPRPDPVREEIAARRDARIEAGAAAYAKYCALCHAADANGYAADHAPSLVSPTFLETASDEQIARGIREGRPGTAMAAYGKARGGPLDEEELFAIVSFLRDRGPFPVPLPTTPIVGDPALGEAVYDANCKGCHGTRTERRTAVHLSNATFLASASDSFLRHAVVHGRPGTPMPGFGGALTSDDIDNVVAFVRSWARPPAPVRKAPPEPPPLGDFIINPRGPHPTFTLRDDRYVPIADVERALAEKKRIIIIDARAPSDWYTMHIPGAISVPYYAIARLDSMPKDGTWITAYCACPHHASGAIVDELRKRGFPHTAVLDEGILEWKKRNYPTTSEPLPPDSDAGPPPVPRFAPNPALRLLAPRRP